MYESDWIARLSRWLKETPRERAAIAPNVWGLGVTSLLTDVSAEMVTSVLPAYLVLTGGAAPYLFGIADGLHHGGTTLARWIGGVAADRWRHYKRVALVGYAVSAAARVGWIVSGNTIAAAGALVLGDRVGKAIRTAPRDALIAESSGPANLATGFGVHRAFDAAGAAIGPLLAFALLSATPRRFDVVFVTSLVVALLGLAALMLLVEDRRPGVRRATLSTTLLARGLFRDAPLRRVVALSSILALTTISDPFLYLLLATRSHVDARWVPLLYSGTAVTFLLLAAPVGRLADRIGRRFAFVAAHAPLLLAYAAALTTAGGWPWNGLLCVVLLGMFYAASDGVLAAWTSTVVPIDRRGSGLALVATATSLSRFVSSITFGAVWTRWGDVAAVGAFSAGLVVAVTAAWSGMLRASPEGERP